MRRLITAIILALLLSSWALAQDNSANAPGQEREKNENKADKGDNKDKVNVPKRPDDHDDKAPVQLGWAVITLNTTTAGSGSLSNLVAFATFGLQRGDETEQAGILPSDLTLSSLVFVSTNSKLSRNIGISIVNPSTTADAHIMMTLHDKDGGAAIGTKQFTVGKGQQTAQFVTSLFADKAALPKDLTGTLSITSDVPVSMIGLRFRGANFSTIPVTNLSPSTGRGLVIPEFVGGGGWATELVLVNTGSNQLNARIDFFKQDGTPMTVRLNGESKSSFTGLVPAGGVFELSPKNSEGQSRF
ncbi:MAG TPA: hypothetical protein VE422_51060 [Terriglobia bacterium]|nr:hypothetical protein [Terriglobia bacterium]